MPLLYRKCPRSVEPQALSQRYYGILVLALTLFAPPSLAQSNPQTHEAAQLFHKCYDIILNANARSGVHYCGLAVDNPALSDTDRIDALIYRALSYKKLKFYVLALADYNQAAKLAPNDSIVLGNRGNLYRVMQRYEPALRDLDRALKLDPNNAAAHYARGLTYEILGLRNDARRNIRRAYELLPADPEIRRKARQYDLL